jgi:hypothetical protein
MADSARRLFNGVQCAIGLATLARPQGVVSTLTPAGAAQPDARIVRVLGLRQAVQGAVGVARPTSQFVLLGALVDAAHALSLVPIIAFSSRYRASAAASAGLATAAAAVGVALAD